MYNLCEIDFKNFIIKDKKSFELAYAKWFLQIFYTGP